MDRAIDWELRAADHRAKGSLIGPSLVTKRILMGVVVGKKNPIWFSRSGMGKSISSVVKPFFSAVWSEPWDHGSSNHILSTHHMQS